MIRFSLIFVTAINFLMSAQGESFSLYNEDFTDRPHVIKSVDDLRELFIENQFQFLPIAPPSDDIYLHSYDLNSTLECNGFHR